MPQKHISVTVEEDRSALEPLLASTALFTSVPIVEVEQLDFAAAPCVFGQ